ncbi:MAG: DUF4404 family protein [Deltaproteobacteria bacterium]|nr:DUF4404 family protein [Deltaproteobacteria bacterium]MBW2445334.1 DUF4404 family protein [Deltaproteobacteria bacterium]
MNSEHLRETLNELRAELAGSDAGDPATRSRVQAAADELDAWLDRAQEPEGGLRDRLREAVARFEEEHPTLSATVQRVVDALADLGI